MLQLEIRQGPEETILMLSGSLDTHETSQLDTQLDVLVGTFRPVVVADLSQLGTLTSIGLKSFIRLERRLAICGKTFVIRHAPPHIKRVFEYCGLDVYFTFEGPSSLTA